MFYYIITIHNKEDLIKDVLDGVNKSATNGKIICVLDGCTDNTELIIDSYNSKFPIIKSKQDDVHELLSLNAVFKDVLKEANDSDFIVTLQDDVILDELNLETLISDLYNQKENLGYLSLRCGLKTKLDNNLVLCEYDFIESEFGHWKQLNLHHFKELKYKEFEYAEVVIKSPTCIPVWLLKKVGFFDENLAPFGHDDLDLCIRLNEMGYKNGIYALKFFSKVEWGGTREDKNKESKHNKQCDFIIYRNKIYLTKKHKSYYYSKSLKEEFDHFSSTWKNEPSFNDYIYGFFENKVKQIPFLYSHSNYIGKQNMGFGELPFHYLWLLLVGKMTKDFKFLEIGVYKGSILSLVKLISNELDKSPQIYGISPLDFTGDKYLNRYDDVNYLECIGQLYAHFNLDISTTILIKGLSTDENIKQSILEEGLFDIVYIDGSHNYDDVVSDIKLSNQLIKTGGYIVIDDSSSLLNMGIKSIFKGHDDVGNAVKDLLESNPNYKHLFACGHNRIFKKIL